MFTKSPPIRTSYYVIEDGRGCVAGICHLPTFNNIYKNKKHNKKKHKEILEMERTIKRIKEENKLDSRFDA